MKKTNLFTLITKFLIIILPFYVIISLFLGQVLKISFAWFFLKELLLVLLFFSLAFEYFKDKKLPKLDCLDYLIFAYILYWIFITFFNWLWLKSIIFGWRYDFMFLIVMLIFKHSSPYLKIRTDKLLNLFLLSGWISLFLWLTFKFVFWEKYLTIFWFVDYVWNWVYSWWVPNYHWLEWTGIRRFQWIFDWPNPMWYFLIIYSFLFLHSRENKKEYYVFLTMIFLFRLIILTYSRSAILGFLIGIFSLFIFNKSLIKKLKKIFFKYKKICVSSILLILIFIWWYIYVFRWPLENIVLRAGSTSGHFERMQAWLKRFTKKPLWAWLAEAWPAFRAIYPEKQTKKDEIYYIPESWYIQILIEGWIIYFLLFISILFIILKKLFTKSLVLFSMFLAVLVMNFFLHIFEASYLSVLLFIFIWLFIKKMVKYILITYNYLKNVLKTQNKSYMFFRNF